MRTDTHHSVAIYKLLAFHASQEDGRDVSTSIGKIYHTDTHARQNRIEIAVEGLLFHRRAKFQEKMSQGHLISSQHRGFRHAIGGQCACDRALQKYVYD